MISLSEAVHRARTFSGLIIYILHGYCKSRLNAQELMYTSPDSLIRFGKLRPTSRAQLHHESETRPGASPEIDPSYEKNMDFDFLDVYDDGDDVSDDVGHDYLHPQNPLEIESALPLVDPSGWLATAANTLTLITRAYISISRPQHRLEPQAGRSRFHYSVHYTNECFARAC